MVRIKKQSIISYIINILSLICARKFTGCYDNSGYAIYDKDRIMVTCYGGPEYYNVFWQDGCYWIKQEQEKEDIEIYGHHSEPLFWLIHSYMGYYVVDANRFYSLKS